ncbi:MAG: patatin-like phospholipase family protein [Clostridium sp.]|jgi:NTE family protein|uniref:patatin-like phospholipase family protein n=1 Tax=Clostridium sp. TaxID=1506 RepID=UPI0025BB93DE|nr:patatin-like phospholipase family protein [Clostridium sp.]MCH3963818.1 patatin-like phospholipase family protein [Clostridium sp.]MCI1716937.1 patatin-like phospholipase family protein [Clostridium sp.]MCI1801344.1 patatin-like phospholipase family protein [Clostridium sp.]MCI1815190.1 patatin-like phospholipase family protein [Clostridium sp.]MCI1872026.1 patatin-like phospholipase family protein [Clostridium sp.]
MKVDVVFDGGGVKAIGLIGAICCFENYGYEINRAAGTSAGAIIAALLSVGYTGKELKSIMLDMNYDDFFNKNRIYRKMNGINILKKSLNLFKDKGLYSSDNIEKYIKNLILSKSNNTFYDVYEKGESKLKIIASDVTEKKIMILPDDLAKYGVEPRNFEISQAVKMSISIPLYFKPVKFYHKEGCSYVVDGGILSNFPIWIFDNESTPVRPTIGFKLVDTNKDYSANRKMDFISYLFDIMGTMLDKNEEIYVKDKDAVRTVFIPTLGVKTTEFRISTDMKIKLFNSGYVSAEKFLKFWNFHKYIRDYCM